MMSSLHSYAVMTQCWYADAEERPHFSELCSIMDQLLSQIADYTELIMVLTNEQVEDQPEKHGKIQSCVVCLNHSILPLMLSIYV